MDVFVSKTGSSEPLSFTAGGISYVLTGPSYIAPTAFAGAAMRELFPSLSPGAAPIYSDTVLLDDPQAVLG